MVRMRTARGVPVVSLKDGARSGYLGEALYDEEDVVCGFTVEGIRGMLRRYVALDDILRIGDEQCVIYSDASLKTRKQFKVRFCKKGSGVFSDVIGREIRSRDGECVGVVRDIAFDMETGMIEGLEISQGFLRDVRDGRRLVLTGSLEINNKEIILKEKATV